MKIDLAILFIGIMFWITETAYFGWNMWPRSPGELIYDGISLMFVAMSIKSK